MLFEDLITNLKIQLKQKKGKDKIRALFPIDSTIVTLTSKLFWRNDIHQVKLFCGLDTITSEVGGIFIHFGQGHDHKHGNQTVNLIPEKSIGVMDRGFASSSQISNLTSQKNQSFVLRLKNNVTLKMMENGNCKVFKERREIEIRVVAFCDLETQSEFRLATNIEAQGDSGINNQNIAKIYQKRWQIELLWKFLKMHLKLDRFMTKNENGVRIQIYTCLIAYLIIQLIDIPKEFGQSSLDKIRYLQGYMCQHISYVHWFKRLIWLR